MKQNTNNDFEDFKVNTKIKLAFLWTSLTFFYLYGDYFELYVPKKTEGLVNGDNILNSPTNLFLAAVLLAIPAAMVFLSISLKPKINRLLNIIFGSFFTALMLLIAFDSFDLWRAFYAFYAFLESTITAYIVWTAWNWTKKID